MKLRLQIMGRRSSGSETLPSELDLAPHATLYDVCAALRSTDLSPATLIVVSGKHVGTLGNHPPLVLRDGDDLLLLAPIAGG